MRETKATICCVCGKPIEEPDHPACPGCLRPVCKTCYAFLPYVWTSQMLKDGSFGAVKVCGECQRTYQTTSITPHPYLG